MNDKQINAAIAEACPDKFRIEDGVWFFQYAADCWSQCHNNSICSDLNAMHEAEKVLNCWEDYVSYQSWLGYCGQDIIGELQQCITATARQRAEAFLRTLGKWEEVQK